MQEETRNLLGAFAGFVFVACMVLAILVSITKRAAKEVISETKPASPPRPPLAPLPPRFDVNASRAIDERCENCSAPIGKLESPQIWNDHIVCTDCHRKLSAVL